MRTSLDRYDASTRHVQSKEETCKSRRASKYVNLLKQSQPNLGQLPSARPLHIYCDLQPTFEPQRANGFTERMVRQLRNISIESAERDGIRTVDSSSNLSSKSPAPGSFQ